MWIPFRALRDKVCELARCRLIKTDETEGCFHPSDHRPYPFCNLHDFRWYHAHQRGKRLCTPPSDPPCSPPRTSSWHRQASSWLSLSETVIEGSPRMDIRSWKRRESFIFKVLEPGRREIQQDHRSGSEVSFPAWKTP